MIGMLLLTLVVLVEFVNTLSGVLNDVVAPVKLVACLISLFATLTLTIFLYSFQKSQG